MADCVFGPVRILSYASQSLVVIFPLPSVFFISFSLFFLPAEHAWRLPFLKSCAAVRRIIATLTTKHFLVFAKLHLHTFEQIFSIQKEDAHQYEDILGDPVGSSGN